MEMQRVKSPFECNVLIVDDEPSICDLLKEALSPTYKHVKTCLTAGEAINHIETNIYDVVVTDLKLPDMSGIDVLQAAKKKDEFTEVIIVTGYASMESATDAINLGVTCYMVKPLKVAEFLMQFERAVATRLFHLKSLVLMHQSDQVGPDVKSHLHDITSLYYFSRKLMLSLEVPEIMRVVLEEANDRMGSVACIAGVNFLEFEEVFAMPRVGTPDVDTLRRTLLDSWENTFDIINRDRFENGEIAFSTYSGKQLSIQNGPSVKSFALPMTVLGRTIGFLALFFDTENELDDEKQRFMYVFTSMVSSIIEHAFLDAQARLQAKTDSLTGVANHRLFHETLEREIARSNRARTSFCLALIDIDDFKKVNDTNGHQVGDAVLVDLTNRVALQNRRGDILARYGGEEFALILPDTDLEGAQILAERVRVAVAEKPFTFSQTKVVYTVSIGVSCYDGANPQNKDRLIAEADEGLYASKRNGKNRVTLN